MRRRAFLATVGGSGLYRPGELQAASRRVYALARHELRNGTQAARLHEFLKSGWTPAVARAGFGPVLVLDALVAPRMPEVVTLTSYPDTQSALTFEESLAADADYRSAFAAWERDPQPPYESYSRELLRATAYSPELEAGSVGTIYELRTYHAPSWRQLEALHERFAGPEIPIFHRCGIHPVLFTETITGTDLPNLTYLTPFADLAARDRAWTLFSGDAEWAEVRRASIERYGQISSWMKISLYRVQI